MSASTTPPMPRTPILCARPTGKQHQAHHCFGCRLTAKAAVYRVAHGRPDPRWREAWTVRAVWSALAIAESDLATVWLMPYGRTITARRFCARCVPTGRLWAVDYDHCGQEADGPIVVLGADTLPGMPDDSVCYERAMAYLQRHGWSSQPGAGLRCAACSIATNGAGA